MYCGRVVRAGPPTGLRAPGLACLPARSRSPANTSGLNHELLSQAFGIRAAWAPARFNKCGRGRRFPPDGFAPPQAPRARRARPGRAPLGEFHSSPGEHASAGAHNVAPSPPRLLPKLRSFRLRKLALPAGRARAGGCQAGGAAGRWGPHAGPPPPPGHPAQAARPPHRQRNGNRFDR